MTRALTALVFLALAAGAASALAQTTAAAPYSSAFDTRVQTVDFDPDRIVPIRAALGYQVMVEFAVNERIENVSIGDALGWQVTPNRRANILFLKPVDGSATNMTVVTDSRRYLFDLSVAPKGSRSPPPYRVRFVYPAPAPAVAIPLAAPEPERGPEVVNAAYVVTGSKENTPVRVFDDGHKTYFEWGPDGALPAIFAVNPDGSESVVNYAMRGPYIVVEQLAGRFMLRNGKQVATVVNSTYPTGSKKR